MFVHFLVCDYTALLCVQLSLQQDNIMSLSPVFTLMQRLFALYHLLREISASLAAPLCSLSAS